MRKKGRVKSKRPGRFGYEHDYSLRDHTRYTWQRVDAPTVKVKDLGVRHDPSGPTAERYFYAEETGVMYRRLRSASNTLCWEAKFFTDLNTFDTRIAHRTKGQSL